MGVISEETAKRLWAKVDIKGPDDCWIFTGGKNEDGYGNLYLTQGLYLRVHRVALAIKLGYWPEYALHTCDNPPCCNPKHLFEGNQQVNMLDMSLKGRGNSARTKNGRAKFTEEQIAEIKATKEYIGYVKDLATKYGVHRHTIQNILAGRSWL